MKLTKFLLITVSLLCCDYVAAQDEEVGATPIEEIDMEEYQPLLVDGREWVVSHGTPEFNYRKNGSSIETYLETLYTHQLLTVKVDGEKEIDGILCKRLVVNNEKFKSFPSGSTGRPYCGSCFHILPLGESEMYAYEKDRKLYIYRNPGPYFYKTTDEITGAKHTKLGFGDPYFEQYLDFNIHKGNGVYTDEYYQDYDGLRCRTLYSQATNLLNDNIVLIEGIGSNVLSNTFTTYYDPEMNFPTCISYTLLVKCTQDGNPLFDVRDKLYKMNCNYGEILSEIKEIVNNTPEKDGSYYNLNGIKITKLQPGEIYIKEGKKLLVK